MGAAESRTSVVEPSLNKSTNSDHLNEHYPIQIRRGRKQSLFLHTINYLALQQDSLGNPFQPCLEDLLYLYGGDRQRTDHVIKVLRLKKYLARVNIEVDDRPKYVPDILVVSEKGTEHLQTLRKKGLVSYEEWQQVQPRIEHLLKDPQLLFLNLRKVLYFQVREMVRLITPFLPELPSLDNGFIAKVVAFNRGKSLSPAGLCQQILGFVDVLLRFQGEYASSKMLREIARTLSKHGLQVDLSKRRLYPHIQIGARLFGTNNQSDRKTPFYKAVLKALNHYCKKFDIEKSVKDQILIVNDRLKAAGRISLDPEARALGIIGFVIPRFFLSDNHNQFPLPPDMGLAGRDQMHQIRKLLRKLDL